MKQQTKLIVLMMSFCFVLATCLLSVFAVKNFDLNMAGEIEFVAPGIEATISQATLLGISKKEDSGQMQEFTLTRTMTESQISDLAGVKSWSGIKLLFDEDSEGQATILFTITNNSEKAIENIMVNISTNTTTESPIKATPCASFCIAPKASHTFDIKLNVADISKTTSLSGFKLTVEMNTIKPSEVLSVSEHKATSGLNFTTNSSSKTAVFTKYTTPTSGASALAESGFAVDIPAVIKDGSNNIYTVTEIASNVFSNSKQITSLTLPSTLTKIGSSAFYQCTNLTGNLIIPVGVKEIGNSAFAYCSGLTGSLVIPNSVTTIGQWAFGECTGLDGHLVLSNNVSTLNYATFHNCNKLVGDIIIPNSVTTMNERVFYECTGFDGSLTLSKNLTSVGEYAFFNCKKLSGDLIIPEGITTIKRSAFDYCFGMTGTLSLPNSLESIENFAFDGCGFTGDLVFGSNLKTIGNAAFQGCAGFTGDLVIGDSVTEISSSAFLNCYGFTGKLTLGKSLTTIGYGAFYGPKFTGELKLPNSLKTIGEKAFIYGRGFTGDLIIPEGVTSIGKNAFEGCSNLKGKFVLPSTLTTFDISAIKSCGSFTHITVNGTNDVVYSSGNCLIEKSTKKLLLGSQNGVIPQNEGITEICEKAFYYCEKLTGNLVIPSTVTVIGNYAFTSCEGLTGNLVIPDSVTSIGTNAFYYCSNLRGSLTLGSNLETIGNWAFRDCSFSGELVIPDSVKTIGESAFCYNDYTKITIGSGVVSIGNSAFNPFYNMTSITITAVTPPTLGGTYCFNNTNNCPIYVPAASLSAYQTATNWSQYASRIVAIPA